MFSYGLFCEPEVASSYAADMLFYRCAKSSPKVQSVSFQPQQNLHPYGHPQMVQQRKPQQPLARVAPIKEKGLYDWVVSGANTVTKVASWTNRFNPLRIAERLVNAITPKEVNELLSEFPGLSEAYRGWVTEKCLITPLRNIANNYDETGKFATPLKIFGNVLGFYEQSRFPHAFGKVLSYFCSKDSSGKVDVTQQARIQKVMETGSLAVTVAGLITDADYIKQLHDRFCNDPHQEIPYCRAMIPALAGFTEHLRDYLDKRPTEEKEREKKEKADKKQAKARRQQANRGIERENEEEEDKPQGTLENILAFLEKLQTKPFKYFNYATLIDTVIHKIKSGQSHASSAKMNNGFYS